MFGYRTRFTIILPVKHFPVPMIIYHPRRGKALEATSNEALEAEVLNAATFLYTFKPSSSGGVGHSRGSTVKHHPIKIATTAMSFPGSVCLSAQAFLDCPRDTVFRQTRTQEDIVGWRNRHLSDRLHAASSR